MTDQDTREILIASTFVESCAATARAQNFRLKIVGVEMLKHGYALLSGVSPEAADRAVTAMLTLYEKQYVDVPQSGKPS